MPEVGQFNLTWRNGLAIRPFESNPTPLARQQYKSIVCKVTRC